MSKAYKYVVYGSVYTNAYCIVEAESKLDAIDKAKAGERSKPMFADGTPVGGHPEYDWQVASLDDSDKIRALYDRLQDDEGDTT